MRGFFIVAICFSSIGTGSSYDLFDFLELLVRSWVTGGRIFVRLRQPMRYWSMVSNTVCSIRSAPRAFTRVTLRSSALLESVPARPLSLRCWRGFREATFEPRACSNLHFPSRALRHPHTLVQGAVPGTVRGVGPAPCPIAWALRMVSGLGSYVCFPFTCT